MKLVINHDTCQHGGDFADRCLAATIRHPLGHERYCSENVEDDGRPELTVVLRYGGETYTLVISDPKEREAVAAEGLAAFLRAKEAGSQAASA